MQRKSNFFSQLFHAKQRKGSKKIEKIEKKVEFVPNNFISNTKEKKLFSPADSNRRLIMPREVQMVEKKRHTTKSACPMLLHSVTVVLGYISGHTD